MSYPARYARSPQRNGRFARDHRPPYLSNERHMDYDDDRRPQHRGQRDPYEDQRNPSVIYHSRDSRERSPPPHYSRRYSPKRYPESTGYNRGSHVRRNEGLDYDNARRFPTHSDADRTSSFEINRYERYHSHEEISKEKVLERQERSERPPRSTQDDRQQRLSLQPNPSTASEAKILSDKKSKLATSTLPASSAWMNAPSINTMTKTSAMSPSSPSVIQPVHFRSQKRLYPDFERKYEEKIQKLRRERINLEKESRKCELEFRKAKFEFHMALEQYGIFKDRIEAYKNALNDETSVSSVT